MSESGQTGSLSLWAHAQRRPAATGDFMVALPWTRVAFFEMARGLSRQHRRALYLSVLARDALSSLAARTGST